MRVFVGQIYVKPGINFPFSHHLQAWLSEQLTELASPSTAFVKRYGSEFDLMIRISAQIGIAEADIKGPTVFKADKDVEYTVFLPFDVIRAAGSDGRRLAMEQLLSAVSFVFHDAGVEAPELAARRESIVQRVCSDEQMLSSAWSLG